jgi:type III secretion system-like peptide-binding chaperone/Chap domain-containing protein
MREPQGFDLDGETSRAWSAFTRRLADRLADMSDGESLTLGLGDTSDDSEPGMARVLFVVQPDGSLRRTEFSTDDDVTDEHVTRQRDADQLATETVRRLKDSYGVMHPAFLSVVGESYEVSAGAEPGKSSDSVSFDERPVEQLTEPVDASDLLELAFAAITHGLGREPDRDVDGDLVVESGTTRIFVRVLEQTPVIQLFSRLVHDISNPQSAPAVVTMLNNDHPFVKFLFADDSVLACVHLPAIPFVPAQLRHMLAIFSELVNELDAELVRRLGGEREIDPAAAAEQADIEEPEGVPPELMLLVRLDPDGQGLDPEQTAEVCSYDRALTRQLLHIAAGQEEVWNAAIKESADDPGQEARCAEEAAGWEATRRSLAGALELIDSLEG